jgi:hypothetical protein
VGPSCGGGSNTTAVAAAAPGLRLCTMGKGRDKKKKANEKAGKVVHGKGAAKTESKTAKGEKKSSKRKMLRMGEGGDDVEAMLASILAEGSGSEQVRSHRVR